MNIVLTVFAPILVAIAIRFVLFLIAIVFAIFNLIIELPDFIEKISKCFFQFDPLVWDESWGYWVLVVIGSFWIELGIWSDD